MLAPAQHLPHEHEKLVIDEWGLGSNGDAG